MSGTDTLALCQNTELTFRRGATTVVALHGTDRNANHAITPPGQQTEPTPELNDVRH
ncbi:hypothetical protein [Streptomyces hokutonensis]|uniref:hypothetical protein n=1 Tax=Streptomyces hokutonensis TaxID=1306990 RepID=UPI00367A9EA3